jgi:hypothetical protein
VSEDGCRALALKKFGNGSMQNFFLRTCRENGVDPFGYTNDLEDVTDRQIRNALKEAANRKEKQ